MSGKKKLRSHSMAVKLAAVRRVEAGEAVKAVAFSFGVRRTQVYLWCKQWREQKAVGGPRGRPRRVGSLPPRGSSAREIELERLVGQQQAELDFFREALRQLGEARRPISGPGEASSSGSLQPKRPGRKAG
ncbi:MAG TPA: transposase [Reyranella sp.]|nr:transposase [Reyranella sp.]